MKSKFLPACVLVLLSASALYAAETGSGYQWSILPVPAFCIAPETGIGYGIAALFSGSPEALSLTTKTDSAILSVIYTQKYQLKFDLNVDKYFDNGTLYFNVEPLFNEFPSFFWGIGPDTKEENSENFSYTETGLNSSFLKEISSKLFLGFYYRFLKYNVTTSEPNGLLNSTGIAGNDSGAVSAPGIRFLWDNREKRYSSGRGFYLDIKAALSAVVLGASSNSYIFETDYRTYYTIFPENIIAFNAVAKFTGSGMPLRVMPRLGGLYLMRGYYEGRYIDNNYIMAQVEYRFPLFWTFRGAIFAGLGQVAPRIDYFKTNGAKFAYGFGLHWKPLDFMASPLRFDLAFAGQGPQLYLDVQEAF